MSSPREAAEARLERAQLQDPNVEVAKTAATFEAGFTAQAARLTDQANIIAAFRRAEASAVTYIARARGSLGRLDRLLEAGPPGWRAELKEIRESLDAIAAPPDRPKAKVINLGSRQRR